MLAAENKARVLGYWEQVWNQRNIALVDDLIAPTYITHMPDGRVRLLPGPEGIKCLLTDYTAAFPDLHVRVEDLIAEGDMVVAHTSWHGTQQGTFCGVSATGKPITFMSIVIFRVAFGKLVECWTCIDRLDVLQQLGAIPDLG
jgi:steroid delta-isomerase-like uncharacterized protein